MKKLTMYYALLETLRDAHKETLCFASYEDADRFKTFNNIYMDDSGAGTGHGAYWTDKNAEIIRCDKIPSKAVANLDNKLINKMLQRILISRTAKNPPEISVGLYLKGGTKGIGFKLDKLPPRQRPTTGDMFRRIANKNSELIHEGRVIKDLGEMLEVISPYDEENGKPTSNANFVTIHANEVMKINDWLKK